MDTTANSPAHAHRWRVAACVLALLIVNIAITAPLFRVEYSAYNGSIENTFIAIARIMAEHPGEFQWWPFWNGGMPFENAYLPFLQWVVAAFSLSTGLSAARSFHIVTAACFVLAPIAVFWMALALSRRLTASFISALAWSCFSLSPLLLYDIRFDAGGALILRRLHVLVFWGGAPQTVALTLLPVAVVSFHRALTTNAVRWKIMAGVLAAAVALSNAFGAFMLAIALLCWLLAFRPGPWWKAPSTIAAIGVLSYCWASPWMSPGFLRATRANSLISGGDYRYTTTTWIALAVVLGGYLLLSSVLRRTRAPAYLQFFALFAYFPGAFVLLWYAWRIAIVPQPYRYHLELDLVLLLALVFGAAALLDKLPRQARVALTVSIIAVLMFQTSRSVRYGRDLIRSVDPTDLSEYKIAQWMDRNRPGDRAFISGSSSFLYNVFTDNPQFAGGHEQHAANPFLPVLLFTIYTGTNAGDRDAEYSVFWLKAFGASAISVSGENSTEYLQPFVNPHKFDGVLPVLWQEGDDRIFEVPVHSTSLAHVMPAEAVPVRAPIHGLDIEPVEPYVAALDDPNYPPATFEWTSTSDAEIRATLEPDQVIAVQLTYVPGWEAYANGARQTVRGDAIGQMVIEPDCTGPCELTMRYTGGIERTLTRVLSVTAMLVALAFVWISRRRKAGY